MPTASICVVLSSHVSVLHFTLSRLLFVDCHCIFLADATLSRLSGDGKKARMCIYKQEEKAGSSDIQKHRERGFFKRLNFDLYLFSWFSLISYFLTVIMMYSVCSYMALFVSKRCFHFSLKEHEKSAGILGLVALCSETCKMF